MNTSKIKATWGAVLAGITAFIAFVANTPPEQQDAMMAPFVALIPLHWRPSVGLITRALSSGATIYAAIQAAKSGPQTPPANPPTE